ncbi:unnamed protein product [Strongylus vulgaris]|uniref:alkaline phosphatase n=1 Tax=Strongylus vulgaris TaxID=40348 RepID=A0A3P7I2F2_STRVU|nr:unnamed protein product [Strongylus vulgaris]
MFQVLCYLGFSRNLVILHTIQLFVITQQLPSNLRVEDIQFWNRIGREHIERKLKANPYLLKMKRPKNVILFVGDGMGVGTVTSGRIHKKQILKSSYVTESLFFENFPAAGLVKTSSLTHHVTDSAAAAMAMFSGWKADGFMLGMKPNSKTPCTANKTFWITEGIAESVLEKGPALKLINEKKQNF